jgi:hypothetical protein
MTTNGRDVAQPGSALPWGGRGRGFESRRPDGSNKNPPAPSRGAGGFSILPAVSTAQVKLALRSLITSPLPTVMVLRGKWGRGKTFLWRDCVDKFAPQAPDRWARYSYVSLFGVESLAELRDAVLANSDPYEQYAGRPAPNDDPNAPSGLTRAVWGARDWIRERMSPEALPDLAGRLHAGGLAHALLLRGVQHYLVCVDDLERRGEHLRLRDVLGYLSNLRDDRQCSVLLILNSDELSKADRDEFELLREKVFDHEVSYDPTAADCVELVFPKDEAGWDAVRANSLRLGIENVRVLQRVRKTFERFSKEVDAGHQAARARLAFSVPLLALCHYSREPYHPPLAFVRGADAAASAAISPEDRARWPAFLVRYDSWKFTPIDAVICDYLERGYIDRHALTEALRAL